MPFNQIKFHLANIKDNFIAMRNECDTLQKKYVELEALYNELNSTYLKLKENYKSLEDEYSKLKQELCYGTFNVGTTDSSGKNTESN